jgi:two-component system, response regulator RegA
MLTPASEVRRLRCAGPSSTTPVMIASTIAPLATSSRCQRFRRHQGSSTGLSIAAGDCVGLTAMSIWVSVERTGPSKNLQPYSHLHATRNHKSQSMCPEMNTSGALLVIEDDADVQRAARIALTEQFARVDVLTAPGDDLEALLTTTHFDAALVDMNFVIGERSGAAGLDALTRIHACDSTLAVVLMTAYGGVQLAVAALKRGATDFVLKPWHNEKLIATMEAAAQITRARRDAEAQTLDQLERGAIERALAKAEGNISIAAAALGLSRPALYRRMSKHGL